MHIPKNRFNIDIQIIRTDNGTEYVNHEFDNFLSEKIGILHQTLCPDTYVHDKCA
jgi:hypothetical protein